MAKNISSYEALCLRSFLDHGHGFDLFTYTPNLGVPQGVRLRDAGEILEKSNHFTYQKGAGKGSHAAFSDLFRYKLLADRGGWWVDTDVVCLSCDIPRVPRYFAFQEPGVVNTAILFFERGDSLMLSCFREAQERGRNIEWGETGPLLITRLLKERGELIHAQPAASAYPVHYREVFDCLRPIKTIELQKRLEGATFLHLWNEGYRRWRVDKGMLPPAGCLLRALADRHPVDGWSGEYNIDLLEKSLAAEKELRTSAARSTRCRPNSLSIAARDASLSRAT